MKRLCRRAVQLLQMGVVLWLVFAWVRPARESVEEPLFEGVVYQRKALDAPVPRVVHVLRVDLKAQGVGVFVSPGDASLGKDMRAWKTTRFLEEHSLQVAINGGFFSPFHSRGPWDYYPRDGDPVNVHGLAISSGEVYSRDYKALPVLCVKGQRASIRGGGCEEGTEQAMAGSDILVQQGEVATRGKRWDRRHPRTAVGLSDDGQTLLLVVVDGRQEFYSEGATIVEMAQIMKDLGADDALNLDGGGSSTMVALEEGRSALLNAPVHTRMPMMERPVANHLGIYARPLGEKRLALQTRERP